MARDIRILLVADSHLGFDLPARPRVERRRRGHDFLANYATALAPALAGEVDVVVHAGDLFHRPRVAASLAWQAYEPLARIADRGVPVFVVPGNHERSRLPHPRFAAHRRVHVFDRPRTFVVDVHGTAVALAGFPYERRDIRTRFRAVLEQTGWRESGASVALLCMHHCVEGATVGPGDFTFTTASDVIRGADLPTGLAGVLSGHIHRHQVLTSDLRGAPLAAPVLYPGSVERTSLAEKDEGKGWMMVDVPVAGSGPGLRWEFRPLPARPMWVEDIRVERRSAAAVDSALRALVAAAPPDAVLRIRVHGVPSMAAGRVLSTKYVRGFAPGTMNVEVRLVDRPRGVRPGPGRRRQRPGGSRPSAAGTAQLGLGGGLS